MNSMLYLLSTTSTYACFTFQIFGWKSWMGTRLLEFGGIRLVINQSVVPMDWSLRLKIGVVFPLSILWGYILYTSTLYIEHWLLILPLFIAICEIWLPRLTYGVYMVLFLKPGATNFGERGFCFVAFWILLFLQSNYVLISRCASPTLVFLYTFIHNMWRQNTYPKEIESR